MLAFLTTRSMVTESQKGAKLELFGTAEKILEMLHSLHDYVELVIHVFQVLSILLTTRIILFSMHVQLESVIQRFSYLEEQERECKYKFIFLYNTLQKSYFRSFKQQ